MSNTHLLYIECVSDLLQLHFTVIKRHFVDFLGGFVRNSYFERFLGSSPALLILPELKLSLTNQ